MSIIRIPAGFYYDHTETRDLPAPPVIRKIGKSIEIDSDHPDMAELINDARFYAETTDGWCDDAKRYVYMARRLLVKVAAETT